MKEAAEKFSDLLDKLLSVPHTQIKAALDTEKAAKKRKKKVKKSSVSREAV